MSDSEILGHVGTIIEQWWDGHLPMNVALSEIRQNLNDRTTPGDHHLANLPALNGGELDALGNAVMGARTAFGAALAVSTAPGMQDVLRERIAVLDSLAVAIAEARITVQRMAEADE